MGNATNNSGFGFRVLKTHPHSPAHDAGIIPFLDFIVNIELSQSELKEANLSNIQSFFNTIQANENKEIHVTLFNIYDRQLRKIKMVPHKNWPEADSLLGVLLRYEEYMTALERTYKVIQVVPGSEAEKLGFMEEYDYVVGLTTYQYKDLGEFIRLLFKAEEVCVFNVKESKLRFIQMPKEKCVLGCQFGEGILNQLPYKKYELPLIEEAPPKQHEDIVDLTEETSHTESQPQNLNSAVSAMKVIEAPPKKNEIHPEHKSGIGLDDHTEKKSYQEMLKATSSKSTLEYIHHKRSEHLKKNGPAGGRFLPKNPFQSPTFKNVKEGETKENGENLGLGENQKENLKEQTTKENPKENLKEEESKPLKESKEPPKEILKDSRENSKEIQEKKVDLSYKEKETRKENQNMNNIQTNVENLKIDENSKQEKKIDEFYEESVENARFAKMVMKYSYYCPKLKDEYVINSSDLMQMTVKIEKN